MISAFGVEHGEISKAMSPNKAKAFKTMADTDYISSEKVAAAPDRLGRHFYANDKLTAHSKGKRAKTKPGQSYPGGFKTSNMKIADQGQQASTRAKRHEAIFSSRKFGRQLP